MDTTTDVSAVAYTSLWHKFEQISTKQVHYCVPDTVLDGSALGAEPSLILLLLYYDLRLRGFGEPMRACCRLGLNVHS